MNILLELNIFCKLFIRHLCMSVSNLASHQPCIMYSYRIDTIRMRSYMKHLYIFIVPVSTSTSTSTRYYLFLVFILRTARAESGAS